MSSNDREVPGILYAIAGVVGLILVALIATLIAGGIIVHDQGQQADRLAAQLARTDELTTTLRVSLRRVIDAQVEACEDDLKFKRAYRQRGRHIRLIERRQAHIFRVFIPLAPTAAVELRKGARAYRRSADRLNFVPLPDCEALRERLHGEFRGAIHRGSPKQPHRAHDRPTASPAPTPPPGTTTTVQGPSATTTQTTTTTTTMPSPDHGHGGSGGGGPGGGGDGPGPPGEPPVDCVLPPPLPCIEVPPPLIRDVLDLDGLIGQT